MAVFAFGVLQPEVHPSAWVADSATVLGRVRLGAQASVWYGAVVRGDNEPIAIGARSNIQDGSVLHTDVGAPLHIGDDVTVGHQVSLHGCTIGDGSLIGMQAVVLNGARIGRNCLVGAGALVTEGKSFPDNVLILGSPAKAVRELTPEQVQGLRASAARYVDNAKAHREGLRRMDAPAPVTGLDEVCAP